MANIINLVAVNVGLKAGNTDLYNAAGRWRKIYSQPFNYENPVAPEEPHGLAEGVATVVGVSAAIAAATGTAAGAATVSGVGSGVLSAVGTAAGTSTADAVGVPEWRLVGTAIGVATVQGSGNYVVGGGDTGAGSSAGVADVQGVSAAVAASVGTAVGTSTATAQGSADFASQSAIIGSSEAAGVSNVALATVGSVDFTYTPVDITLAAFNPRRDNPQQVSIQNPLGSPMTMSYSEDEVAPDIGQHVIADFGDGPLFQGPIQQVATRYHELPTQVVWDVNAVDYIWFLNRKRPFGYWQNVSASQVAAEILSNFVSSDFTSTIEPGLPNITFEADGTRDVSDCFSAIAKQINGAWRLEAKDVKLFINDVSDPPDDVVDDSDTLLPGITYTKDATQLRTRFFVKGVGTSLRADANVGDPEIDVDNNEIFSPSGGWVIMGSQRIRYSGKTTRNITLESPENKPSVAGPAMFAQEGSFANVIGTQKIAFALRFVYADGTMSDFTALSNWIFITSHHGPDLSDIPIGPPNASGKAVIARRIYYIYGFDTTLMRPYGQINDNTTVHVTSLPWSLAGLPSEPNPMLPPPPGPTFPNGLPYASETDVTLTEFTHSNISSTYTGGTYLVYFSWIWPDGTESLMSTVSIIIPPEVADGHHVWQINGLPTLDSGGVPEIGGIKPIWLRPWCDNGQGSYIPCYPIVLDDERVNPDRTSAYTMWDGFGTEKKPRTAAPMSPPEIELHYFLTGIPSSGPGSIVRDVPAHFQGINTNTNVRIFEQVDDFDAQQALAIKEGGDGVHEDTIEGNYESHAVARAAGQAMLALYSRPIDTVNYPCRDRKVKAGKDVFIHTINPPIGPFTLKIQDVSIDQIHEDGSEELIERYNVTASSLKLTFDDLMQQILARQ